MGKHVLGPVYSLATPKNGRKWPKNVPFLTKKSQAWQACSWLNQTKWKRFDGPYDIYIDGKTCVRALLLIGNSQKWQKMAQKLPFFDQKKPSMAGLLLTQPNQMETLWWAMWHLHRWENMYWGPFFHCYTPKKAKKWPTIGTLKTNNRPSMEALFLCHFLLFLGVARE